MRPSIVPGSVFLLLLTLPLQAGPSPPSAHRLPAGMLTRPVKRLMPSTLAASLPFSPSDPAAQDLLKRMLEAENSLALAGDQVTTVSQNGLDISSEQQVQRNGAHALRLDYVRPQRLAGEQIIDNGRFYCHLLPASDTLEISPSRMQMLRVRVAQIIKQIRTGNFIVQSVGQAVVADHTCTIVQVSARSATPVPYRRFWIDPTNGAQLRIEQYDAGGQLQSASYYTQVTYNPVFDKAVFRVPHAGSKVITRGFAAPSLTLEQVRAQAGFAVSLPDYLPTGYRFQAGSVSVVRNHPIIELRYFNGVSSMSLFETPDSTGQTPSKFEHPRQGILFGRQGGMKIVLIGNLGNGELEQIAGSIH